MGLVDNLRIPAIHDVRPDMTHMISPMQGSCIAGILKTKCTGKATEMENPSA